MVKKAERDQKLKEIKKRKLDEIAKANKEDEIIGDPDDYENYGKGKKKGTAVENKISKINQLDKFKEDHIRKVTDHNIKIRSFEEMCCDFTVRH